jgi:hypothetical protein
MQKFIIEKGYFNWKKGWQESENGSIYAVIPVDRELKQIGDGDVALDIDDIPKAIRRIKERKEVTE